LNPAGFVQRPDLTIPLAGPTHTELLLKDGRYFLRTRVPIRDRDTVVGEALAEEPFLALTKLKLAADARAIPAKWRCARPTLRGGRTVRRCKPMLRPRHPGARRR
jgi:hypothetical protein